MNKGTFLFAAFSGVVLSTAAPQVGSAQATLPRGVIDGVVADTGLAPIAGADVFVVGSSLRVATGANGRFRIVGLPAGQYVLSLQREGFATSSVAVDVAGGDTIRLSLTLEPAGRPLDSLAVRVQSIANRRAVFDGHRARARGYFFSESDVIEKRVKDTRDLLRGLSLVRIQGSFATYARAGTFRDACAFQLFVNGKPLPSTVLDGLPPPGDLPGLEVYVTLDAVPSEYRAFTGDYCGAIVAWSKSGSA